MKIQSCGLYLAAGFLLIGLDLLSGCNGSFTTGPGSLTTPTPTITPTLCSFCSPTPTSTATNSPTPPAVLPTITPTPNSTATIPMGLFIAASYTSSITDYGLGFPVSVVVTLFTISVNHNPEDTATMSITTPSNGTIPLTWLQDANLGAYWVSQYASYSQYSYVPNGVYSCDLTTSLGTAHASMNAPGNISFSSNGASVTALYPGNYDAAVVSRISPAPATTYSNAPGTSVGSPFTFPSSAYNSPSFPATFGSAYAAATTITSFSGTAGAVGAFVGTQVLTQQFTR